MLYIYIFEDGSIKQLPKGEPTADDYDAADDGLLDILRIRLDGTVAVVEQYTSSDWFEVEQT